ncbi:MAG: hypothetical protein K2O24_07820 [Muribaculaceae bacterium]|nr:hypothetical protein [Muribaculaceae bacterium]
MPSDSETEDFWWNASKGVTVTAGSSISVVASDSNYKITKGPGVYKFIWVPETKTLTVKKQINNIDWAIKIGDEYIDLTDTNNNGVYNITTNARKDQPFELICYEEGTEMSDPNNQIEFDSASLTTNTNVTIDGEEYNLDNGKFPVDAQYYIAYNSNNNTLIINYGGVYQYAYVLKTGSNYIELANNYGNWEVFYQQMNAGSSFQIIPYYPGTDYKQAANCQPAIGAPLTDGANATKTGTTYSVSTAGKYTVIYNPIMNTLDVHTSTARWWIAYDMGSGWKFDTPMEQDPADDNVWKAFVDFNQSTNDIAYFTLFYGERPTGWSTTGVTRYYLTDGEVTVDTNGSYGITTSGNSTVAKIKKGEWTVELNSSDMKITFTLGDSMGAANIIITRGDDATSYSMNEIEPNVFTSTQSIAQGDKLLFNIENVNYIFKRESQSTEVEYTPDNSEVIYTYELEECPADNTEGVEFWYATEVDFTINITTKKARISVPTEGVTMGLYDNTIVPMQDMGGGIFTWTGTITEATPIRINIRGTRYTIDTNMVGVADEPDENGDYTYTYPLVPLALDGEDNRDNISASDGECTITVDTNNNNLILVDNRRPSEDEVSTKIVLSEEGTADSSWEALTKISDGVYTWTGTVTKTQMVAFTYKGVSYGLELQASDANRVAAIAETANTKTYNYTLVENTVAPLGIEGNTTFTVDFANKTAKAEVEEAVPAAKIIITPAEYNRESDQIVYGEPTEMEMTYSNGEYSVTCQNLSDTDCILFMYGDEKYTFNPVSNPQASEELGGDRFKHYFSIVPATDAYGHTLTVDSESCTFTADFSTMILAVENEIQTSVKGLEAEAGEAVYFNLQGQRVTNPSEGIFIRVLGGKAEKVLVK